MSRALQRNLHLMPISTCQTCHGYRSQTYNMENSNDTFHCLIPCSWLVKRGYKDGLESTIAILFIEVFVQPWSMGPDAASYIEALLE